MVSDESYSYCLATLLFCLTSCVFVFSLFCLFQIIASGTTFGQHVFHPQCYILPGEEVKTIVLMLCTHDSTLNNTRSPRDRIDHMKENKLLDFKSYVKTLNSGFVLSESTKDE